MSAEEVRLFTLRRGQAPGAAEVPAPLTRCTYDVCEVAKLLGVGRNAVYEAIDRGEIACLRFGKRIVIPRRVVRLMLGEEPGDD